MNTQLKSLIIIAVITSGVFALVSLRNYPRPRAQEDLSQVVLSATTTNITWESPRIGNQPFEVGPREGKPCMVDTSSKDTVIELSPDEYGDLLSSLKPPLGGLKRADGTEPDGSLNLIVTCQGLQYRYRIPKIGGSTDEEKVRELLDHHLSGWNLRASSSPKGSPTPLSR